MEWVTKWNKSEKVWINRGKHLKGTDVFAHVSTLARVRTASRRLVNCQRSCFHFIIQKGKQLNRKLMQLLDDDWTDFIRTKSKYCMNQLLLLSSIFVDVGLVIIIDCLFVIWLSLIGWEESTKVIESECSWFIQYFWYRNSISTKYFHSSCPFCVVKLNW